MRPRYGSISIIIMMDEQPTKRNVPCLISPSDRREPLEMDTQWECEGCQTLLTSSDVEAAVTSFSDQIQRLYEGDR